MPTRVIAVLLLTLQPRQAIQAQPVPDLVDRVPDGFALCVTVQNLREHWQRWQKDAWLAKAADSPLGKAILQAPEIRNLQKFETDLQAAFDLNWSAVRDDLLGGQVIFAFKPSPSGKHEDEEGLLLVHARRADLWQRMFDKLNDLQKENGELKLLEERKHQGQTYWKRSQKTDHWVVIDGPFLAVSNREAAIRSVLERKSKGISALSRSLKRAGQDKAFLSIWVNPRVFDKELDKAPADAASNPIFKTLLSTWKSIDAAVVTADWTDNGEIRLFVQPIDNIAEPARKWFERKPVASEAWARLPEDALFAFAGKLDFAEAARQLSELVAEKDSKEAKDAIQRLVGSILGLDVFKEILPAIGPDLGFAVFAAKEPHHPPQALFALRMDRGKGEAAVDQAMVKSLQVVVGFSLFDWNRKQKTPIRLRTKKQDGAEIHYLSHDKQFPPGFQPAFGLKDGYLLLATAPEAFTRFRAATPPPSDEAPIARLSPALAGKLLAQHRDTAVAALVERQSMTQEAARERIDALQTTLALFERIAVSQSIQEGQLVWTVRITPAAVAK
ncbi:MAG: DUF3352 domain-containing protein [Gemmataceae bacterium]|nr:DUF3352 domain-containing protein [Gemmataceae bacterium]